MFLVGKKIDFNIIIKKANGLPERLCKDTYVKYSWYLDNREFQTEVFEGVERNPEWNYKHHMTVDCVTEDMIKYLNKDALCFKVYGTPTNEKFRKQLTMDLGRQPKKEEANNKASDKSGFTKTDKKEETKTAKETIDSKITNDKKGEKDNKKDEKGSKIEINEKQKDPKKSEEVTKVKKNQKVIKMVTTDGQTVEVVKERNGCCTIF
jgi:hypothetical protein